MALRMKRSVGHWGVVENTYVTIDRVEFHSIPTEWEFTLSVWMNKEAREFAIFKSHVEVLMWHTNFRKEVPYNQKACIDILGIDFGEVPNERDMQSWDEYFSLGPWEDPYKTHEARQNVFFQSHKRPLETWSYATQEIEGFPTDISSMSALYSWFYTQLKTDKGLFHHLLDTPDVPLREMDLTMEDDVEAKKDVIDRYKVKYPLFDIDVPMDLIVKQFNQMALDDFLQD